MSLEALLKALLVSRGPSFGALEIAAMLGLALALAAVVAFVARLLAPQARGGRGFVAAIFLVAGLSTMATAFLDGNVALALALIGIASLLRFRVPLSSPLDNVMILWAVTIGMACGSRYFAVATGATFIGALLALILLALPFEGLNPIVRRLRITTDAFADAGLDELTRELTRKFPSVRLLSATTQPAAGRQVLSYRVCGPASADLVGVARDLKAVAGVVSVEFPVC